MLRGRTTELAALTRLLESAEAGAGGAVVLRGEAGIGKTALLDRALHDAAGRGMRVLRLTGVEAEAALGFAGLVQLLWPLQDRLDALPPPQADALRAVLGAAAPRTPDRFLTGLAVLTLLAELAEEAPVLVAADDAHWLDPASAEALLFAARRLAAERVAVVFAARDGFAAAGVPEIPLHRLGPRDAERVLAGRGLAPAALARIRDEAQGNPLALVEFAAAHDRGVVVGDCVPPLPVTERVLAGFRERVDALPAGTRTLLLVAAADGRRDFARVLAASRALGAGPDDLGPAERAGLVEVSAERVAFRHPLVATAAYQRAALPERFAAHRALADAADDPDCAALHLAAAAVDPDPQVGARLAAAAERALDRAAYSSAAHLFASAARIAARPERGRLLAAAADAALLAGDVGQAADLADRADPDAEDPARRAALARIRSVVEFERGAAGAAARLLVDHTPAIAGTDPGTAAAMLRTAAGYAWFSDDPRALAVAAERLADMGRADPGVRGMAAAIEGDHERGLPLMAAHIEEVLAAQGGAPGADERRMSALYCAVIIGDDDAALALAEAEIAACRAAGLVGRLPKVLQAHAQALFRAGRHREAEASVAEAAAIARDTGLRRRGAELDVVLAFIAAVEGDTERCAALADGATESNRAAADAALVLCDVGHGRHAEALERLAAARQRGGHHTAVLMAATADQVEAAARLAEPERAAADLDRFEVWARSGGQPWAQAVAARCRALLGGGEDHFARALALHDKGGRPFERARSLLAYGEWLRRARRPGDARSPLRAALADFDRLRAAPWAERARAELRAVGAPASAVDTAAHPVDRLTPQELQVVRLAAEGHSSAEIGARLFLSRRTVEHHLYKAYPKLGVRSRRELARLDLAR
ncbi:DNA-binding CsgD family transcriptional regulator [Streptomonospora nanhaiensis]|uniref:DNA-binding CsgD family transcriptional regulator n=1 Tax=Streptomonospora nanhaiensis TaxID=1323731 RepID=A0A853BUR7_9ACTN|nr:DNA-binding CsgD family transcriptional regulator [Streptomonospora nanhaiensis]